MDKLSATTTRNWVINNIEFTAVETVPEGSLLVEGIVENPDFNDVWYFGNSSYEDSEIRQLVSDGYLEIFWPEEWCSKGYGCFVIRLKLDDKGRFEVDGSVAADCVLCKRAFNFLNNGYNMIETAPSTGTVESGGTPSDWDPACTPCINADPEEEEYPYDFDDEF